MTCFRSLLAVFGIVALWVSPLVTTVCADNPGISLVMSTETLNSLIAEELAKKPGFQPGDLINRGDAQAVIAALDAYGWKVSDAQEILDLLLPQDHIIVKTFETQKGSQFMRKVDDYKLIYDRLHRTAELPGGKALVRDIVKLPNGEIYAKIKPVPGNPNFTDLLPKGRNGKTPPPTNFDQPTGYIYTMAQLQQRLEESRKRDFGLTKSPR